MDDDFLKFKGNIYIVSYESKNLNDVVEMLNQQTILGFDIESRPSFKKGKTNFPSLIQLSSKEFAVLYRIKSKIISPEIIQILENKNILKVGTGLSQDLNHLKRLISFNPESFVDIQHLAKLNNIENISLKKLTMQLLNKNLSKRQQLSNWDLPTLSEAQILYAATDAYACLLIYEKLMTNVSINNS